jgi:hypothetical protein
VRSRGSTADTKRPTPTSAIDLGAERPGTMRVLMACTRICLGDIRGIPDGACCSRTMRPSPSVRWTAGVREAASQWASLANWAALSLQDVARDLARSRRQPHGSWDRTPMGPLIQRTLAEQDKPSAVSALDQH